MLVDNAVVVLEAIDRRHRGQPDREQAALEGAQQVAVAVTTSTLATVIVFLPLLVGAKTDLATWLKEIGIAITIALGCSLFSAMMLIPLTAAHVLGRKKTRPVPFIERLEERYVRALAWTLAHRAKTGWLLAGGLLFGLVPFFTGMVEAAMFSGTSNERLFMRYEFDDFTFKSEAERAVDRVEDFFDERKAEYGIASLYSYYTENEALTVLTMERKNLSDDEAKALRERIRDELPVLAGVRVTFEEESDQGGDDTYFSVRFFGQDTALLEGFAAEAERRLGTVANVKDIRTPFREARREIHVAIDREKARRAGLTAQDMAGIFSFTLGSMRLPRFNAGEREVETWLALRLEDRENLEDLRQIQIGGGDGGRPVLLGDIARFEIVPRPAEIVRENRKVTVAVRATYEGEDWEETKKEIEGLMNAFALPPGYSWGWNDRIIEQEGHSQQMMINMLLAICLVYIVMASLFESLAQPFAIL
ncbi:MAG: efflux RND transporter permease subunit, partial [Candidatus Rokuibacteriota bacterium]